MESNYRQSITLLNIKGVYVKELNTLARNATIKELLQVILVNTKDVLLVHRKEVGEALPGKPYCQTPLQLANPTQLQLVGEGVDFVFPR